MAFRLFLILLFGTLVACKKETVTTTSSSSGSSSDTSSDVVRWSSTIGLASSPLALVVGDSFTTAEANLIDDMADQWDAAVSDVAFFSTPLASTTNKDYSNLDLYNDSEMGVYQSSLWFSDVSSSALAITQYFAIKRNEGLSTEYMELVHADIIFNNKNFTFSTDPDMTTRYDFPSVVIHEMGHFLGLGHTSFSSTSVMRPSISSSDVQRNLFTTDQTNIQENYASGAEALESESGNLAAFESHPRAGSTRPKIIRGIIELHKDTCHHYEEGKLVRSHPRNHK